MTIPDDGYADGGVPYSPEEMRAIHEDEDWCGHKPTQDAVECCNCGWLRWSKSDLDDNLEFCPICGQDDLNVTAICVPCYEHRRVTQENGMSIPVMSW